MTPLPIGAPSLRGRRAAALAFVALSWGASSASLGPADARTAQPPAPCTPGARTPLEEGRSSPLRFGVTAAGQVYGSQPEHTDPAEDVGAVTELAGNNRFLVRINRVLAPHGKTSIVEAAKKAKVYTDRGFEVSLQLRYGSVDVKPSPEAFIAWMRKAVRILGRNDLIVGYEVTNEANYRAAPDNSDGSFEGVIEALAGGLKAADDEADRRGYRHIRLGFNWYYPAQPEHDAWFWEGLTKHRQELSGSVDWVGLNAYPGTFDRTTLPTFEGDRLVEGLDVLRNCHMPSVGLGPDIPIRIMENGYPSNLGRPEPVQATALETMARAAYGNAGTYNVTDYNWFTLRDAATSTGQISDTFGLLRTDYVPKEAFHRYRGLIEELGEARS